MKQIFIRVDIPDDFHNPIVDEIVIKSRTTDDRWFYAYDGEDNIEIVTPPDDDEIGEHFLYNDEYIKGAKWMRDRILKKGGE